MSTLGGLIGALYVALSIDSSGAKTGAAEMATTLNDIDRREKQYLQNSANYWNANYKYKENLAKEQRSNMMDIITGMLADEKEYERQSATYWLANYKYKENLAKEQRNTIMNVLSDMLADEKEYERQSATYWLANYKYKENLAKQEQIQNKLRIAEEIRIREQAANQLATWPTQMNKQLMGTGQFGMTPEVRQQMADYYSQLEKGSTTVKTSTERMNSFKNSISSAGRQAPQAATLFEEMSDRIVNRIKFMAAQAVTLFLIYKTGQSIVEGFTRALQAVDQYKQDVATGAAVAATFMKLNPGESLAEGYERAHKYASALIPVLERIADETLMSGLETTKLNQEFMKQGVYIDANNKKQIDGFKAFSNAMVVMTKNAGGLEHQILSEVKALFGGGSTVGAQMLSMLSKVDPKIKEHIQLWKKEGDAIGNSGLVLEKLLPMLSGFDLASGEIAKTWQGVSTTIGTTVNQILRGGTTDFYEKAMSTLLKINDYLREHKEEIQNGVLKVWEFVEKAIINVWNAISTLSKFLVEHKDLLKVILGLYIAIKAEAALSTGIAMIGAFSAISTGAASAIGPMAGLMSHMNIFKSLLPLMITPIGLVATALGILAVAFLTLETDADVAARKLNEFRTSAQGWNLDQANEQITALNENIERTAALLASQKSAPKEMGLLPQFAQKSTIEKTEQQLNQYESMLKAVQKRKADLEALLVKPPVGNTGQTPEDISNKAFSNMEKALQTKIQAEEKSLQVTKAYGSMIQSEIDNQHRRGLMNDEAFYSAKQAQLVKDYQTEMTHLDNMIGYTIEKYNIEKQKIAEDAKASGASKALSQKAALMEKDAKLDEIASQRKILYYKLMENKQKLSTDTILNSIERESQARQHQVEMLKLYNNQALESYKIGMDGQVAALENMHEHALINDTDYYKQLIKLAQENSDFELSIIEKNFNNEKMALNAQLLEETGNTKKRQKLEEELEKLTITYQGNRVKLTKETVEKILALERKIPTGFSDGWDEGIRKYILNLENQFKTGENAATEFANNVSNAIRSMFDDPSKAAQGFFKGFLEQLKKTAADALMNPIMVQMKDSSSSIGQLFSPDGPIAGASSYLLGASPALKGNNAGAIGGIIGAGALSLAGGAGAVASTAANFASASLGASSALSGAIFTSLSAALPILAPLIGIALGNLIGGIGGGGKVEGTLWMNSFNKDKAKEGITNVNGSDYWYRSGNTLISTDNIGQASWALPVAKQFEQASNAVKKLFEKLGADVSGFNSEFIRKVDKKGQTPEQIQENLQRWFGEWISQATNVDFSQFQKGSEKIIETITRVVIAMSAMDDTIHVIGNYIEEVNSTNDLTGQIANSVRSFGEATLNAQKNIDDIDAALKSATDPTDIQKYSMDEVKALYDKYQAEKKMIGDLQSMVSGLDDTIKQLNTDIRSTKRDMTNWLIGIQGKIDQLTGSNYAVGMAHDSIGQFRDQYLNNPNTTPEESLNILNATSSAVDTWLQNRIAEIQSQAQSWTYTDPGNRDMVQAQIDAVQLQLDAIDGWRNLLENIHSVVNSLKTSTANPADVFERLQIQKDELFRIANAYYAETDVTKKQGLAEQGSQALQDYLKLAQEAYQRPSKQYQDIYNFVMASFGALANEITTMSEPEKQTALQQRIVELNSSIRDAVTITSDNSAQINAMIQDANAEAADYYTWIKSEGQKQYELIIADQTNKLIQAEADKQTVINAMNAITGGLSPEGWLATRQQDTVNAMQDIKSWTETYWANFKENVLGISSGSGSVVNNVNTTNNTANFENNILTTDPNADPIFAKIFGDNWNPIFGYQSYANEGFASSPTLAMIGDAPGERGEWVLHDSTVKAMMNSDRGNSGNVSLQASVSIQVNEIKNDYDAERLGRETYKALEKQFEESVRSGRLSRVILTLGNNGKVKH